ncbi:MAG: ATP-dependent Clp protease ATP-binding subunit [Firmicutes bacterium]|nr:ATP-dependent Clp protease ATP-binding subunit [Bacillota bacterium]
MLKLCSRCKQRPAVVYINKINGDKVESEGLCIKCAKELGIKPFSDYIEKMGISDDDIEQMEEQMQEMLGDSAEGLLGDMSDDSPNSTAPSLDLKNIFGGSMPIPAPDKGENSKAGGRGKRADGTVKPSRKNLNAFCLDLTAKAREGKLDRVIGRDKELNRLIQILCRRQKNNPCLIGEPGVGKTAIAEALAQKIASRDIPYRLQDKEVFVLDMTALVAGTHFRGQFESRIKALVDEIKNIGNIILVIDEVHTIVGAGDAEGGMNAANILKPALSRGELQVIGATTLAEYRKYIEKDQALERRFQPIVVREPSMDSSVEILKGVKHYYETHHGLKIPDSVLRQAVVLSERYITDRFLPDKAIDLLDEACAGLSLSSDIINRIDQINAELREIRARIDSLESVEQPTDDTYARLAECKTSEARLMDELKILSQQRDGIELSENDLARVIEAWTDIPAASITQNEFDKLNRLADKLHTRLVGQDKAIDAVCRAIKRSRTGVSAKRKPTSFIFAGPTGVGKTELVKQLARELFNSPESLIRLDMSEFMEKHSVARIIGAPPGYVGYDDAGQLTEKIRRKPYSVILFDEIEKAHPDVMNILLQILDDGRITDAHGKEVNFENTIIVMTTNAGSDIKSGSAGFSRSEYGADEEKTKKALDEFLRPEFINRVDEIITFNRLGTEEFARIAEIQLSDLTDALAERGIAVSYTPEVPALIAEKSFSRKYGARNLRRFIQTEIEDKIASGIIDSYSKNISTCTLSVEGDDIAVLLS